MKFRMRIHILRRLAVICFVALLMACSLRAENALTILLPLELQVTQRNKQNQADITISGVAQAAANVIEAKADLAIGIIHGKAV